MNMNHMTEKAREALLGAPELAGATWHPQIEPEHLLVTLASQKDGVVRRCSVSYSLTPTRLSRRSRPSWTDSPRRVGTQPGLSHPDSTIWHGTGGQDRGRASQR